MDFNAASNNVTAALQLNAKETARRVAAALSELPGFGALNQPGHAFGASLEKQVHSPDYPNISLVVHATALERHGLYQVMLSLAIWDDVRVLTDVIKVFFRRLLKPICDSDSWKSLVCLIPENTVELDESSLVYTLRAIRAKLHKIRSTSYLPLNVSPTERTTSVVS